MGSSPVLATLDLNLEVETDPNPCGTAGAIAPRSAAWSAVAELVIRARDGDRDAFGRLVEQFQRTVHAIALQRLGHDGDAQELTQDVFLHVLHRLDQVREPERFAGWLRQVTHHMAINRATRRVPPSSLEDEVLAHVSAYRDDPHEALVRTERSTRLWEALARLKPLDRESLVAFYIQGRPLAEIAEALDVPLGTIKRRLHTARRRLRAELAASVQGDADEWTDSPCFTDPDGEEEDAPALAGVA
jgi:RNA polymerase sigma-70 factor (ECF subfamily)